MKYSYVILLLCVGCSSNPNMTVQEPPPAPAEATAPAKPAEKAPRAVDPFSTLNNERFEFASLTWSSTVEDFDHVLGARATDNVVNPRSRYTCYDTKLGVDPVMFCAQFSSGTADYVYVVAQSDYGGKEKAAAFADWNSRMKEQLGEGKPETFHHRGSSLDWYLADGTKIRLSKENDLRIDFWHPSITRE